MTNKTYKILTWIACIPFAYMLYLNWKYTVCLMVYMGWVEIKLKREIAQ